MDGRNESEFVCLCGMPRPRAWVRVSAAYRECLDLFSLFFGGGLFVGGARVNEGKRTLRRQEKEIC